MVQDYIIIDENLKQEYINTSCNFYNIILRDIVFDSKKNPYLGNLYKVLKVEKNCPIEYPKLDDQIIDDIVYNRKKYYIFEKWETLNGEIVNINAISNQNLLAKRNLFTIPNIANVQLVNEESSMIDEFIIYSTKDFVVNNRINANGYDIEIIKNTTYYSTIHLYETSLNFIVNFHSELEGNCICIDDLKLNLYDINENKLNITHNLELCVFSSDSSTGD